MLGPVPGSQNQVRLLFRVTNTGRRAGTEVAQAYVGLPGEKARRLVGWSRVTLSPGRSRDVEIRLSRSDLAELHLLQHYAGGRWVTPAGRYQFQVGDEKAQPVMTGS